MPRGSFREKEEKYRKETKCEHSRSLQRFVQYSKYKENIMKKHGRTVQLFVPAFKTITWGKRLAKKIRWKVTGCRKAGSFRGILLSQNQLNK